MAGKDIGPVDPKFERFRQRKYRRQGSRFYEEEIFVIKGDVVEAISLGATVRDLLALGFPRWATILKWMETDERFKNEYLEAREKAALVFEGDIIDIARELTKRAFDPTLPPLTKEQIRAAEVHIGTLRWVNERRAPKMFGNLKSKDVDADQDETIVVEGGLPDPGGDEA